MTKKKKKDETGKLMDVPDENIGPSAVNNRTKKIVKREEK